MSDQAQLDILIQVREELSGLRRSQEAFRQLRQETSGFATMFKTGLGIDIARRAMDLLVNTMKQAITDAFNLAANVKAMAENIGISTTAYQVLGSVVKDTGGDIGALNGALNEQQRSLVEAALGTGKSYDAYQKLRLSIAQLRRESPEHQFEMVARAVANASDKQEAFAAAADILGGRNVPKLRAALEELASKGYDELSTSAERAGKVMSAETIARLTAARQALGDAWDTLVVKVGEDTARVLALMGQQVELPKNPDTLTPEQARAAQQKERDLKAQADATFVLTNARQNLSSLENESGRSEIAKRGQLVDVLRLQAEQLEKIRQVRYRDVIGLEYETNLTNEQLKQLLEANKLESEAQALRQRAKALETGGVSAFTRSKERFEGVNSKASNPNALTAGEGVGAGAFDFVSNLGSVGEQVAAALQASIGAVVDSISEGIYGWITGTESFSDVLLDLGDTVFRTMINTIVQMGVQWLITQGLILLGMGTIERAGDAYRAARVVKENAAEVATLPAKTAGAAAAGISSYGVAIAFGVAAIAMIAALSGGFKKGGYTGDGNSDDYAGPAHKGEYYFNASDVKRIGVSRIEAFRFGRPDVSNIASSPAFTPDAGERAGAGGGSGSRPLVINALYNEEDQRRALFSRDSDALFVDMYRRNRHEIET